MQQMQSRGSGQGAPAAGPLIVAGLGAHLAVVTLTRFVAPASLLTALVATLVFAGVILTYASRRRVTALDAPPAWGLQLQAGLLALVIIAAGAWLLGRGLGTGANFYCEPLVPWRIEIALFGSFALGYLTAMARPRRHGWVVYPAVMVGLLWIAPFYGFFSAPMFLGVSLSAMCPDRSMTAVILMAFGMIAGEQFGRAVADWLSAGARDAQDDHQ